MSYLPQPRRGPLNILGRTAWTVLLSVIAIHIAWQLLRPILLPFLGVMVLSGAIVWWLDRRWRW